MGLKEDLSGPQETPAILKDDGESTDNISDEESIDSDEEKSKFANSARPKNEDAESKRVRFQYFRVHININHININVCLVYFITVTKETSKRR